MDETLYEKLIAVGIRFVSYRPRSQKEIREYLQRKMMRWDVAGHASLARALARLGELGYLDDQKFAQWWIDQRNAFRPKGKRALVAELAKKGITVPFEFDESNAARDAIKKKLKYWQNLPTDVRKKKIYTYLGSRGFSSSTIGQIIDDQSKKA